MVHKVSVLKREFEFGKYVSGTHILLNVTTEKSLSKYGYMVNKACKYHKVIRKGTDNTIASSTMKNIRQTMVDNKFHRKIKLAHEVH